MRFLLGLLFSIFFFIMCKISIVTNMYIEGMNIKIKLRIILLYVIPITIKIKNRCDDLFEFKVKGKQVSAPKVIDRINTKVLFKIIKNSVTFEKAYFNVFIGIRDRADITAMLAGIAYIIQADSRFIINAQPIYNRDCFDVRGTVFINTSIYKFLIEMMHKKQRLTNNSKR